MQDKQENIILVGSALLRKKQGNYLLQDNWASVHHILYAFIWNVIPVSVWDLLCDFESSILLVHFLFLQGFFFLSFKKIRGR